jgi:hypothetical protein
VTAGAGEMQRIDADHRIRSTALTDQLESLFKCGEIALRNELQTRRKVKPSSLLANR